MEKRRILTIIPTHPGWTATHNDQGDVEVRPIVCWALVDSGGAQIVMAMVTVGRQIVLCDEVRGTFVGTSPPSGS